MTCKRGRALTRKSHDSVRVCHASDKMFIRFIGCIRYIRLRHLTVVASTRAILSAGIASALGPDVPVCGCTGAAVIGKELGEAPVLIEEGPALSVSLVFFAGQVRDPVESAAIGCGS